MIYSIIKLNQCLFCLSLNHIKLYLYKSSTKCFTYYNQNVHKLTHSSKFKNTHLIILSFPHTTAHWQPHRTRSPSLRHQSKIKLEIKICRHKHQHLAWCWGEVFPNTKPFSDGWLVLFYPFAAEPSRCSLVNVAFSQKLSPGSQFRKVKTTVVLLPVLKMYSPSLMGIKSSCIILH